MRFRFRLIAPLAMAYALWPSGCGMLDRPRTFAEADEQFHEAKRQREEFRATASPAAIRWLFTHELKQGMSLDTVEQVLGQPGVQVHGDGMYKRNDVRIRETDTTWRWGPDADGQTWILFFRNNRLTNFNPADYAD